MLSTGKKGFGKSPVSMTTHTPITGLKSASKADCFPSVIAGGCSAASHLFSPLDFGAAALFQASSTKKIHEKPQKSLWILLDFLVRIEPFQGVTLTPRPGISLLGSSPRNNGIRPLISRDRAPGGVRRRRLACAVDRAFHGDEDHSTGSDYRKEITGFVFPRDRRRPRPEPSRRSLPTTDLPDSGDVADVASKAQLRLASSAKCFNGIGLGRRPYPMKENPAKPKSIIAQVEGSGTVEFIDTSAMSITVPGGLCGN